VRSSIRATSRSSRMRGQLGNSSMTGRDSGFPTTTFRVSGANEAWISSISV